MELLDLPTDILLVLFGFLDLVGRCSCFFFTRTGLTIVVGSQKSLSKMVSTCRKLNTILKSSKATSFWIARRDKLCLEPIQENVATLSSRVMSAWKWEDPNAWLQTVKLNESIAVPMDGYSFNPYLMQMDHAEGLCYIGTTSDSMHVVDVSRRRVKKVFHVPTNSASQYRIRLSDRLLLSSDHGVRLFDLQASMDDEDSLKNRNKDRGCKFSLPMYNVRSMTFLGANKMHFALAMDDTMRLMNLETGAEESRCTLPYEKDVKSWKAMEPVRSDDLDMFTCVNGESISLYDARLPDMVALEYRLPESPKQIISAIHVSCPVHSVLRLEKWTDNNVGTYEFHMWDRRANRTFALPLELPNGNAGSFDANDAKVVSFSKDGLHVIGVASGEILSATPFELDYIYSSQIKLCDSPAGIVVSFAAKLFAL